MEFQNFFHLYTMLLDISTLSGHNFKIFLSKTKNLLVTWSKSLTNEIFVVPSIFVFNANNPRKKCINEKNFEIPLHLRFSHSLIMLLHRNFNCRFHHVPDLAPLWNFPKIISLFLAIFKRNPEKKLIRGGGQMIFWN